jgi:hypothetical protein
LGSYGGIRLVLHIYCGAVGEHGRGSVGRCGGRGGCEYGLKAFWGRLGFWDFGILGGGKI